MTFLGVCRFRRLQFTEEGPFFQAFHDFKKGVDPVHYEYRAGTGIVVNYNVGLPCYKKLSYAANSKNSFLRKLFNKSLEDSHDKGQMGLSIQ